MMQTLRKLRTRLARKKAKAAKLVAKKKVKAEIASIRKQLRSKS